MFQAFFRRLLSPVMWSPFWTVMCSTIRMRGTQKTVWYFRWILPKKCKLRIYQGTNYVRIYMLDLFSKKCFLPDFPRKIGRPKVSAIGVTGFYSRKLVVVLEPHPGHTTFCFVLPYCILYLNLHALRRRLPVWMLSGGYFPVGEARSTKQQLTKLLVPKISSHTRILTLGE